MLRAALYALTLLSVMPLSAQAHGGDEMPFIATPNNVALEMLRLGGVGPGAQARVQGLWCGRDGAALQITQRYVEAWMRAGAQSWAAQGRLDGNTMRLLGSGIAALAGRFDGDTLVLGSGTRVMPALKWPAGTRLARTVGERCP